MPESEVRMDYGEVQRFLLAERLHAVTVPNDGKRLYDEPAEIQQTWRRVADEAIAALKEEPVL